ncbi:serine/threonine protein kinase [Nostoc sp. CENA67]|uniref:non-specific serine/threonine protein kinase n=1 Tax=Amazonocrinis nigriterrae CENA67 TaxID=2794033 RepID=A0A8J7HU92_9NOST|nr:serine/threonine-protein kinase [Amazonocrinis nigriterrae]MBH8565657.1 serine/threonine protein kinase [Amazonocrinis nigriterrae CENA67]
MRQYPLIRKTLKNRYQTVTPLAGGGSGGNTYLLTGGTRNQQQYPVAIKKILRNRFKIVKLLARGGSGDTYLAVDLDLPGQPYCVVKHFHPKYSNPAVVPIAKNLFAREAEGLYQLGNSHDQIPRLFAHFDEDGDFFLVQEFIDGHNLTKEVSPGKILSENTVFNLLKDILEVLVFVHQHNIIHRDIKPQNLMRRHSDNKIVLIDFGCIKKISALGGNLTVAVGTPGYMPSEQAKGKPKLSSDIYAVGMIGIQALTGIPPEQLQEELETGEVIWRDKAQVSDRLADILDKMVRERHNHRYQSAAEALEALLPNMALPQSLESTPSHEHTNDNYLEVYRKFLLFLGVGLGTFTSILLIILVYTFLHSSTLLPKQPDLLEKLRKKFVEPLSAHVHNPKAQRELYNN